MISIVLSEFSVLACFKILLRLLWFCQTLVANPCNDSAMWRTEAANSECITLCELCHTLHTSLFHSLTEFRVKPEQSK